MWVLALVLVLLLVLVHVDTVGTVGTAYMFNTLVYFLLITVK
jgi:hypothetical protein